MKLKIWMSLVIILLILCIILVFKNFLKSKKKTNTDKVYIFWTGGYDSTFRLCQALIDERKQVQPVYVSDIIDNDAKENTRRHNIKQEYEAMKIIDKKIRNKYPYYKQNLLPLIDIKKVNISQDIQHNMNILKKQKRVRRAVCQYGGLAQVSKDIYEKTGYFTEISVEKEPHGSMMYNTVYNKVECMRNICHIAKNLEQDDKSLNIFKYMNYPTLHLSKKDMLKIAKKNNYDDILNLTWSCWYPRNGKPCGNCIMCKERII